MMHALIMAIIQLYTITDISRPVQEDEFMRQHLRFREHYNSETPQYKHGIISSNLRFQDLVQLLIKKLTRVGG